MKWCAFIAGIEVTMADDLSLYWSLFHGQFPGESNSLSVRMQLTCPLALFHLSRRMEM